jgi:FlaA1/EpsC-like NDP-sugar epimerase
VLDFPTSIRGRRDVAAALPLVRWSIPDLRVKRVLVFGAGAAGRQAVQLLRRVAPGCVMGVADNDPAKRGVIIEDRPVRAFADIPRESYDVVVIASLPGRHAIAAQLDAAGLAADRDYLVIGRVEQWYSVIADDALLAA